MLRLLIILVIIIIIIVLIFKWRPIEQLSPISNLWRSNEHLTPRSDLPILTIFKSGGFVGMVYELRVYDDKTYELYDHGKLKTVGRLNEMESRSVDYLISVFPTLNDSYCEVKGYDMITHGLKVGDRYVSFGTMNTDDQCMSQEIEKQFAQLSDLMI